MNLTPGLWYNKPMPKQAGIGLDQGLKHGRLVYNPDDRRFWNIGGDWTDTVGDTSGQQEIYAYDPDADIGTGNGLGWSKIMPFCPAAGTVNPGRPDQVTACWDSNRHIIWCIPGYMPANGQSPVGEQQLAVALNAGGNETEIASTTSLSGWPVSSAIVIVNDDLTFEYILYDGTDLTSTPHKFTNCQRGFGGTPKGAHPVGEWFCRAGYSPCGPRTTPRASLPWTAFSLDPATPAWQLRSKIRRTTTNADLSVGEGVNNGFYDAVGDTIIRISGTSPVTVRIFSLPSLDSVTENFSGLGTNSVAIGNNDIAWNQEDRIAYIIQPGNPSNFLRYDVAAHTMTKITGTGAPPYFTTPGFGGLDSNGINCYYPKWDNFNKKILWPAVHNFSNGHADPLSVSGTRQTCLLKIYHPTLNTWTADAMEPNIHPLDQRGNTWAFHPVDNYLMGMGRSPLSDGQIWFFRFASTSPAHRPTGLSTAIR